MPGTALRLDLTELDTVPYDRPASRLAWRRRNNEFFAGDYTVALVAPHRWEVFYRGYHESFQPTRTLALARAEDHHREATRARDLRRLGIIGVMSLAAVFALYSIESPGSWVLLLQVAIAFLLFVGFTAVAMFQATLFRNRRDPYRRREPWEKKANWLERLLRS